MNFVNKIIYTASVITIIGLILCYCFFLFKLPALLTSPERIQEYENILKSKTGLPVKINNLKFKTHPNFNIDISADSIYIQSDNNSSELEILTPSYNANLFNLKHGNLYSDCIYLDINSLRKYLTKNPKQQNTVLRTDYFPSINIGKAYIKLTQKSNIDINFIKSTRKNHKIITEFRANINTPYTKNPVIIGKNGSVIYEREIEFDKLSAQLDNSEIFVSGKINDLQINGKNLPVKELEQSFLYFYKLKNPNKRNFIENFTDFGGTIDLSLHYADSKLDGICIARNLKALFSKFKIPVFLPKTVFYFKDKDIYADTKGFFGPEPTHTDFKLTGLGTKDLLVTGSVASELTNNITKSYFPYVKIIGSADAKVNYKTQNGNCDVFYKLTLDKGDNLVSDYGNLDNTDKIRQITMHTHKLQDPIEIKNYDYSIVQNNNKQKLFYGNGLFERENGLYKLSNLSFKTNNDISLNYIKSFLKDYIKDGTFNADLKYFVKNKTILGDLNLYNISHKDFLHLYKTQINIEKNKINVNSIGEFFDSPITMKASADNNFKNSILIHDIYIHLNQYRVQRGTINHKKTIKKGKSKFSPLEHNIIVERGKISVDKIYSNKFEVYNASIYGTLKNHIVNFTIPKTEYAKGLLSAKGKYNIANHSSDIRFFASDIDSNIVVTNIFKLPNQVEGKAYATLHLMTKNKLNDVKAVATFAISDGFLPQIGTKEFIINSSKKPSKSKLLNKFKNVKVSLSKITNIDFSKHNIFYSNLYGSFNAHNEIVKDIKLFSKSDYLSMFIEGDYDINEEYGTINIWGRRNKSDAKGIKIFKIPLNLIYKFVFKPEHTKGIYKDKIKLIPDIKNEFGDDIAIFRIFAQGKPNVKNGLKVELKDLRD